MKQGGVNALEVVTGHVADLKQRLHATLDPDEKDLLQKRIRNLESVLHFLTSTRPDNTTSSSRPHARGPSGNAAFARLPRDVQTRHALTAGNGLATP